MRRILALSLLLCAAALGQRASLAQTQPAAPAAAPPARERLAVTVVQVKPEMTADFENLIKNEYHQALSKAGAKWVDVWRTARFGDWSASWLTGRERVCLYAAATRRPVWSASIQIQPFLSVISSGSTAYTVSNRPH